MIAALVVFLAVAVVGLTKLLARPWPTYVHWNIGDGSRERYVRDLLRMIKEERPDLIGLNECRNNAAQAALHFVARATGYRLVCRDNGEGSKGVAFLVAPEKAGVNIVRIRLKKLTGRTWVGRRTAGSKRTGIAEAKYALILVVRIRGRRRKAIEVHFVPSGAIPGNNETRRLHGRQVRGAAYAFTRVLRGYLAGDVNADQATRTGRLMLHLLRRLGRVHSTPSHGKRHIDVFITRGLHATIRELHGYGSDHDPQILTEKPRKTRRKEK